MKALLILLSCIVATIGGLTGAGSRADAYPATIQLDGYWSSLAEYTSGVMSVDTSLELHSCGSGAKVLYCLDGTCKVTVPTGVSAVTCHGVQL